MISIDNYDFKGKRAIIRVDFNVPIMKKAERLATSMGTSLKRCNVSSPAN